MVKLKVTAKGQVTLRKEVLRHLGVAPGDQVEVDLLPGKAANLRPLSRSRSIDDLVGCLGPYDGPVLSIEEMNQIIADGWAGKK